MTDTIPAYGASLLLHPSRRKEYIEKNWKPSWQNKVLKSVKKLWREEYGQREVQLISAQSSPGRTVEPDEFDLIEQELDVIAHRSMGKDEFDAFINAEPILIKGSALNWWLAEPQRRTYPHLSQMAINLLSVPAMSAEAERVFSGARRQIPWSRAQLGAKMIEQLECLKHWITKEVLSNVKIEVSNSDSDGEADIAARSI